VDLSHESRSVTIFSRDSAVLKYTMFLLDSTCGRVAPLMISLDPILFSSFMFGVRVGYGLRHLHQDRGSAGASIT